MAGHTVRRLKTVSEAEIAALSDVLIDCVTGGASVHFMNPVSPEKSLAFWRSISAEVKRGARALLVAEDDTGIVGTVQVVLEVPENQPHRAELSKMLVHRRGRKRGIGAALIRAAEDTARREGRTLMMLDTATTSDAERLYRRMGWQLAGVIPGYALWPDGGKCDAGFYYRKLD